MKYRTGFVSNSSSSSFFIHGMCIEKDWEEIENAAARIGDHPPLTISDGGYDGGGIYVGVDYEQMKDEQTQLEFKARAQKICDAICDELGIPHEKCINMSASWYNG